MKKYIVNTTEVWGIHGGKEFPHMWVSSDLAMYQVAQILNLTVRWGDYNDFKVGNTIASGNCWAGGYVLDGPVEELEAIEQVIADLADAEKIRGRQEAKARSRACASREIRRYIAANAKRPRK